MKYRVFLSLFLCISLVSLVSLRPDQGVGSTGGRASTTATTKPEGIAYAPRYFEERPTFDGLFLDSAVTALQATNEVIAEISATTTTVPPTTTTEVPVTTTAPPPPVTEPPPPPPPPAPETTSGDSVWDRLAQCESGGNWHINTGNGYYGGLQFSPSTWHSVGGTGLPHEHSRETQIHFGKILQQRAGWGQWPHCSRQLGLR
jgi:hypothetical protein